jgi:hypothetical protein
MKKIYVFFLLMTAALASAQVTVSSAIVPQYTQGRASTNNSRTPFWFWAQVSGLTPGGTYRVFSGLDSLGAASTSNGAGNLYLINMLSAKFRRSVSASMLSSAGYDSLTADVTGTIRGWFGVEPTANGRFTPGDTLYPKIMLNNGAGGTTVATRVFLTGYPVTVLNYSTTAGAAKQGSAIYDSASTALVPAKSFAALYDNTAFTGRPLSLAVVEDDSMYLNAVASVAAFYRNMVDSMPQRWGTILPNDNASGVRGLQYFDFFNAQPISAAQYTDNDGNWCSGAVTVNPANGSSAMYLNSNFALNGSVAGPDTLQTGAAGSFTASTNGSSPTFTWDFGDGSATVQGANPSHTYTATGTYTVSVIVQTPYCGVSQTHTVVVEPGTSAISGQSGLQFSFHPNPAPGLITLSGRALASLEVCNALGEKVLTLPMSGDSAAIDLGALAPGVYWLRVTDVRGGAGLKKLVKL